MGRSETSSNKSEDYSSQLEKTFDIFFETVSDKNFYKKYDDFAELVQKSKRNFNKKQILLFFVHYYNSRKLNEAQEEVFLDFENRLSGCCSPNRSIFW
jgi:hypothetical protein